MVRTPRADAAGVRVVHHIPGRMRVRVDGTRDEAEMLRKVQPLLAGLPGIVSVRANPVAGSVVVVYGAVAPGAASHRVALARKLLVPLAVGVGTRLLLPRRRGSPWWLDVALLALDAIVSLQGSRLPSGPTSSRRGVRLRAVRKPPP